MLIKINTLFNFVNSIFEDYNNSNTLKQCFYVMYVFPHMNNYINSKLDKIFNI